MTITSGSSSIFDPIKASFDGLIIPTAMFVLSTLVATSIAIIITWIVNKKQVYIYIIYKYVVT